jgi:predicted N-formylglutamate amidohydrolase
MGLDPFARRCHLALDIGAGPLTEQLAKRLGVTAVMHNYSRLVVDCNRQLMDPSAFLEYGDGILVPGNRNLHQADKDLRASALYWPYHCAIDEQVQRLGKAGPPPAFIRGAGYQVGDNEPYSGKAPQDFTIDHHAEEINLPHIGIEVRQDLIDDDAGVAEIATVMHRIIASIPEQLGTKGQRISA